MEPGLDDKSSYIPKIFCKEGQPSDDLNSNDLTAVNYLLLFLLHQDPNLAVVVFVLPDFS